MKKTTEKGENNLLMAQTTQDASFGPVLVNAAHAGPPRLIKIYIDLK